MDTNDLVPPNPWHPEQRPAHLKVLGKLGEESGELATACCRCIIQGIDEVEPVTGKVNRVWLEDEIADVLANIEHAISFLDLDRDRILDRQYKKLDHISNWRSML